MNRNERTPMTSSARPPGPTCTATPPPPSWASSGSSAASGLPECATPPEEVYELAKARGMDFVTITDHDTIAGCLEIADRPDVFVSEELTTWFAGEPQAVHVLCYGITPRDHEFLQAHARDLETCAAYLHEREITCALAHPFFPVAAPLEPAPPPAPGRAVRDLGDPERLAGSRAEHAGGPLHRDPRRHGHRWLRRPRRRRHRPHLDRDPVRVDAGRVSAHTSARAAASAHGDQGGAAKWAHTALALAADALDGGRRRPTAADQPRARRT